MIEVIPAIDIIGGRCVRLTKGDYGASKTYGDPLDMARAFAGAGARRLHVVDLDGAKASRPENLPLLEKLSSTGMDIEWGGGIKSREALDEVFGSGARYAIVGSVAALRPELFRQWLEEFGPERMILGADVKDGLVAVNGWLENSDKSMETLLGMFPGLRQSVCTDISRDGMLCGPDAAMYLKLQKEFPEVEFTVSGGISCDGDIRRLDEAGLRHVIVGKAFYEGKISLEELGKWWQNA